MKHITIHTDGSCTPNPGPGGCAAILRYKDHERVVTYAEVESTNQRMELWAAIIGLAALKERCEVLLVTDSTYVCNGIGEWMSNWKRNNWMRKGKLIPNAELWDKLSQLCDMHNVEVQWVKGHADNELNNRADILAKNAIPQ
jgi:ribonuclease HI